MSDATVNASEYDILIDLLRSRTSVRKLKPDPIPDDKITQILEAGRWAMSGANGQPWDFIVVKDPETKKELFWAFAEEVLDFNFWMEQQREPRLRHPAYQLTQDSAVQKQRAEIGWSEAPALIVIVGDGRRQAATIQGGHIFGREQTHLSDGLANASMLMHLACSAVGLASQHVTITIQERFKRILGVPDLLTLVLIMPIGYAAVPAKAGVRRDLDDMVHHEQFDMSKYMTNEQALQYLYKLREQTVPIYANSYAGRDDAGGRKR